MYAPTSHDQKHHSPFSCAGLPGNVGSRLDQYNNQLYTALEHLMMIKEYRTLWGMRTYSRFYVVAIWPLMGPYFAWVYQETGQLGGCSVRTQPARACVCT